MMQEKMQGIKIAKVFLSTVEYFMDKSTVAQPLYVESKKGLYMNFSPDNFRGMIKHQGNFTDTQVTETLATIRDVGVILADRGVTNAQSIKGKSTRVITVRKKGYLALKRMVEGGENLEDLEE